jgi:class 3 adenylate cyclase/tetratricopeptide (TPR) repeat protein
MQHRGTGRVPGRSLRFARAGVPQLRRENPEDSRFCSACGAALEVGPALRVRKTVTIVFCDLVGSTALGERTDPEVLRELMGRYHAELRAILERHGGTVEKFVGDAAMAVFGLPQVHEDDALRAIGAAVEMREAVARLGLEVRIGMNTGEVVADAGETLVTGDAVNVAARLEQAAGTGEILIGAPTERLVRERVRAEPIEALALKGKREPVPTFRVLELLDDVPAFTRPMAAPFVGRHEELDRLERALAIAVETRTPQLATIVGPPGIGKSRLARELIARAEARVLVGRCLSYGEGITYWPLQEMAAQIRDVRALLAHEDDGDLAAERFLAAIGEVATPCTPEEIAWGARRLFETIAADEPLVVVFDDIHWAESTFLDLIEYVTAFAQGVPILILCTARADLFDQRPTWTAPRSGALLLTLEPLSEVDSQALVTDLGEVPAEAIERIVETAEGNPLFVEQLVALRAESGEGLEVPPSLQALLAARIDLLAEPERAVVERGSVEGRLFHRGAVSALLPEPERVDVGGHLLTLVRKELIRPDRALVPGDDGFRFGHALIRDAAYDEIPKRQRAALHEAYADWLLSRLGDDTPDEIVGYHLERAYRYGAELGSADPELGARAAERLARAGQDARTRSDAAAAANLFGRAAELVPEGPRRPGLLVRLGEALHAAGEIEHARSVLEEARSLAAAAGDAHVEWLARIQLAWGRLDTEPEGAAEEAIREGEAAIEARQSAGDDEVLARAWELISDGHNWRGEVDEWKDASERAVAYARLTGDLALEVHAATHTAGPVVYGPTPVDEGLRYADDLLARLGHVPDMRGLALHVRGHMRARLGQFNGAFEAVNAWREHQRELGQEAMYATTAACAYDVCLWAKDWARGEVVLREGYEMFERMGKKTHLSTLAAHLGEAVFRQGRLDEAEGLSGVSEELGASDDLYNEAMWRRVRAKVLGARGDLDGAEALARQAVELAADVGFLDDAGLAWLDLAEILRAAGKEGAGAAAAEALALFERKGNLVGVGWARASLDESGA